MARSSASTGQQSPGQGSPGRATGERAKPPGCWYDLVRDALAPLAIEEDADDGDGKVWRYRKAAAPEDARLPASAVSAMRANSRATTLENGQNCYFPAIQPC